MFRTIFRRQFITFIGCLLIVLLILGVVLSSMIRNYFYKQRQETLLTQCERVSNEYINSYVKSRFPYIIDDSGLQNVLLTLYNYLDTNCFVCDIQAYDETEARLRLKYATPNLINEWSGDTDRINTALNSVTELKQAYSGNCEIVYVTGMLNGTFNERMMVVGYPINYNDSIYGVVFMYFPVSGIENTIREVVTLTILCLVLSAFIALILIYFSSRTISYPIRQINEVAKVVAAGRFNGRLTVKSKDEVGELADSFNFMAESLENQEISRRSFISNISHDLRTPLTSMKGFIQAMLDGTIPPESHDKYLRVVLDETDRITKMANDLMFIGKFQNFDVELTRSVFDINELVRTTLITFERGIYQKNLNVDVSFADEKNTVDADYEKIQRVVYNLIDNAVKYTEPGGSLTVKTILDQRYPDKVLLSVKDDGPGIPASEHKKIFDRFYKSDQSRGQDKAGSGLGLAIVKEFIQAHGETVGIISNPAQGKGCEFVISLAKG